jgi:DNA-binding NtrC family response regulator
MEAPEMALPRVLVVDDESLVRRALIRSLRGEYEVVACAGPAEALAELKRQRFEVAIIDQNMPEMSGLQLLNLLYDRYPDTARIMLTGHADTTVAVKAINDGKVYRILLKPWTEEELKVSLRLAVEQVEEEREARSQLASLRNRGHMAACAQCPAAAAARERLSNLASGRPASGQVDGATRLSVGGVSP